MERTTALHVFLQNSFQIITEPKIGFVQQQCDSGLSFFLRTLETTLPLLRIHDSRDMHQSKLVVKGNALGAMRVKAKGTARWLA